MSGRVFVSDREDEVNEDCTSPHICDGAPSSNDGTSAERKDFQVERYTCEGAVRLTKLATIFTGDEHLDRMINSIAYEKLFGTR